MEIEENIRRSDEVQDILGQMPPWLIRWGGIIVVCIFLILMACSILIKYPDTLSGKLIITSDTPPIHLVAQAEGRLKLLVNDNKVVQKDDYIAYIENTTPLIEVIKLKQELLIHKELTNNPFKLITDSLEIKNYSNLGQLQDFYSDFKLACDEYVLFSELNENQRKAIALKKQLALILNHKEVLVNKRFIYDRSYEIAKRQYKSDYELYKQNALSRLELDKSEEKSIEVLDKKHSLNEEIIKNDKEVANINSNIDQLLGDNKEQLAKLEFKISNTFNILRSNFDIWEKKYVIKSPFKGAVSFYNFWTNNQYVKTGDDVAYVISKSDNIFARLQIHGNRFGKIELGQNVRITLDSYSSAEHGFLYGTVKSISVVNTENLYTINVSLKKGLITSYNQKIKFMPEMRGTGEVITKDMSIIERFFYRLITSFTNKKV